MFASLVHQTNFNVSLQREVLQAIAPSTAEGHYLVPQVID